MMLSSILSLQFGILYFLEDLPSFATPLLPNLFIEAARWFCYVSLALALAELNHAKSLFQAL